MWCVVCVCVWGGWRGSGEVGTREGLHHLHRVEHVARLRVRERHLDARVAAQHVGRRRPAVRPRVVVPRAAERHRVAQRELDDGVPAAAQQGVVLLLGDVEVAVQPRRRRQANEELLGRAAGDVVAAPPEARQQRRHPRVVDQRDAQLVDTRRVLERELGVVAVGRQPAGGHAARRPRRQRRRRRRRRRQQRDLLGRRRRRRRREDRLVAPLVAEQRAAHLGEPGGGGDRRVGVCDDVGVREDQPVGHRRRERLGRGDVVAAARLDGDGDRLVVEAAKRRRVGGEQRRLHDLLPAVLLRKPRRARPEPGEERAPLGELVGVAALRITRMRREGRVSTWPGG